MQNLYEVMKEEKIAPGDELIQEVGYLYQVQEKSLCILYVPVVWCYSGFALVGRNQTFIISFSLMPDYVTNQEETSWTRKG